MTTAATGPEFERVRCYRSGRTCERGSRDWVKSPAAVVARPDGGLAQGHCPALTGSLRVPRPSHLVHRKHRPHLPHPHPANPLSFRAALPVEETLRLPPVSMTPAGLAHDSVSGRFVIADRERRKLVIVDERAHHLVDLVDAESAGFNEITALVIDTRRGDLWVVSGGGGGWSAVAKGCATSRAVRLWPSACLLAVAGLVRRRAFRRRGCRDGETVFVLDVMGKRIFPVSPSHRSIRNAARPRRSMAFEPGHRRRPRRLRGAQRRARTRQPGKRSRRPVAGGARHRAERLRAHPMGPRASGGDSADGRRHV